MVIFGTTPSTPPPAGSDFISVSDISGDGQKIVGRSEDDEFQSIAILWTAETGTVDLNKAFDGAIPRGWRLTEATAISEDGRWIVGQAENPCGSTEGFILEIKEVAPPKPEIAMVHPTHLAFENNREVVLSVSHNGPNLSPVTVSFRTVGDTALPGKDYVETEGTVTFAIGSNLAEIHIPLINDSEIDLDKTFKVVLSNPSEGFDLIDSEALVTIGDNEMGYEIPSFISYLNLSPLSI